MICLLFLGIYFGPFSIHVSFSCKQDKAGVVLLSSPTRDVTYFV